MCLPTIASGRTDRRPTCIWRLLRISRIRPASSWHCVLLHAHQMNLDAMHGQSAGVTDLHAAARFEWTLELY